MPTKNMIGVRIRNRSGSVDSNAMTKRIEQRALQSKKRKIRIHRRFKSMPFEHLIEMYSPTPEEERDRMLSAARRLLPERLLELGVFPETLRSVNDINTWHSYDSGNVFFFHASYFDSKYQTTIHLPFVKVVMEMDEITNEYKIASDPVLIEDTEKAEKEIDTLHDKGVWDREEAVKILLRKKTVAAEGQGSEYTKDRPGTRIRSLFNK